MKFSIKNRLRQNIADLMRESRYHYYGPGKEKSEMSFIRPLGGGYYPQFHIFLKENKESRKIDFKLHLDQKGPSYEGSVVHSGQYEGEAVQKEAERIKEFFAKKNAQ